MKKLKHKWTDYIKQLYIRYKDDDIPSLSSQLTYTLLTSLFPFLLFLLYILSYTPLSSAEFTQNLHTFLPIDVSNFINGIVREMQIARSPGLLSIGAVTAIWSASRGVNAISVCLHKAYDTKESRPFWKVTGMTLLFTIGFAVMILFILLFLVFGQVIANNLFAYMHGAEAFLRLWELLRYILPPVTIFLVFTMLYRHIPSCCPRFREVLPGSIFCTIGWIAISLLFSLFVNHFTSYMKIYGSVGSILILLLWIQISSIIVLLGGEINAIFAYFRSNTKIAKYENFQWKIPFLGKKKNKRP